MKRLIVGLCSAYVFIAGTTYLLQDSLLFFPFDNDAGAATELAPYEWEVDNEGETLRGWFIPDQAGIDAPLIIYFGGNAEDVAQRATRDSRHAVPANFLYVNYRGYGSSTGEPSEEALFSDALRVYDAAVAELPFNGSVFPWGRSLGSGVAVHLAAHRPVAGLILVTPYDSILEVARNTYPFLPVQWMLRHRFESVRHAPELDIPALVFIVEDDRVVPPEHADRLVDAWAGATTVHRLTGRTHNSVGSTPEFFSDVIWWLKSVS